MGRKPNLSLEGQLKRAEESMIKSKAKYDADAAVVKDLIQKIQAERNKELLTAISNSTRTYSEIMEFIKGKVPDDED